MGLSGISRAGPRECGDGAFCMRIFIDSADAGELKALAETGLVDGVTTNPSLVAKEGRDFFETLKDICASAPGPVSAEVVAQDYETMLAECRARGEEPSKFLKFTKLRYGHLPDFRDANIPTWTETAMTPDLIEEWWRIVSPTEFQVTALVALKTMWEGASQVLSSEARAVTVPWDAVVRFVDDYRLNVSGD